MKLRETVYHVRNMEESIRHYTEKLGGKLIRELPWGVAFIDIDGKGGIISLFSVETYYLEQPHVREFPGPKILISVDDLDAVRAQLISNDVMVGPLLGEQGDIRAFEAFDADRNAIFYMEDPNDSVTQKLMGESA